MYGLLVGFGIMFDKGQKQSSTLSCDSSYFSWFFNCFYCIVLQPKKECFALARIFLIAYMPVEFFH